MLSNLPPGCSSADGGIDHEWEKLHEDIDTLADEHGLTAEEVMQALKCGVNTCFSIYRVFNNKGDE